LADLPPSEVEDLLIPIYLDTNALLDLLASLEGGFSLVEKISSRAASSRELTGKGEAGTEFGIPNVLNLLKIRLGASLGATGKREEGGEVSADRYHTYGSLLYRFRRTLYASKGIKVYDGSQESWDALAASDFIELAGVVRPNPLADSLAVLDRILGFAEVVGKIPGMQQAGKGASAQAREIKQMRQFLQGVLADLEREDLKLLVIDLPSPRHRAVATIFTDYLRDKSMTELAHREYKVLGKIVRKLSDPNESIELLRGTALGGLGNDMVDELISAFKELPDMNLPTVAVRITGPAVEIVPIAIFV
jgi:hypothetical protein